MARSYRRSIGTAQLKIRAIQLFCWKSGDAGLVHGTTLILTSFYFRRQLYFSDCFFTHWPHRRRSLTQAGRKEKGGNLEAIHVAGTFKPTKTY